MVPVLQILVPVHCHWKRLFHRCYAMCFGLHHQEHNSGCTFLHRDKGFGPTSFQCNSFGNHWPSKQIITLHSSNNGNYIKTSKRHVLYPAQDLLTLCVHRQFPSIVIPPLCCWHPPPDVHVSKEMSNVCSGVFLPCCWASINCPVQTNMHKDIRHIV